MRFRGYKRLKWPGVPALIVGLTVLLAACVPSTPPPAPPFTATVAAAVSPTKISTGTRTPTPEPAATATSTRQPLLPTDTPSLVTISVWENLSAPQAEQLAADVAAFQSEFPQYVIDLNHFDTTEAFQSALRSNQAEFDVVLASPPLLAGLLTTNQLAPMSDFYSPGFLDKFAAVTLAGATQNQQLWGLPETAGFHLMLFYNRDLIDTPPATTADLVEQAAKLTGENQWGLALNSYDPLWLVPWLMPYGGWLIDAAGQPTLDTPAMVQALTLLRDWETGPDAIAPVTTYDEMQTLFVNADIPLMINGDWAIGELRASPELNWGVAPLPAVGDASDNQPAVPLVLAKYWVISRDSTGQQAQAASTFLEFVTRPERQLAWAAKFGTLPTQRRALDDPLIVSDSVRRVSAAQLLAGRAIPLQVNANLLFDAMRGPLRAMLDGTLSPEDTARQMQANVEQ